jgi:formyltetrahydrofolate synthetase
VIVATIRGIKAHSGQYKLIPGRPLPDVLSEENLEAVRLGAANLQAHIANVRRFNVPVVVAINRFPSDSPGELCLVDELARQWGVDDVAVSNAFICGGEGSAEIAKAVQTVAQTRQPSFEALYQPSASLIEKIETVATGVYGAGSVEYGSGVRSKLRRFEKWGYGHLPVCFAKTQYSLSHDPALLGAPTGFALAISDVQLAAGAGFVRALCGEIMTMPGLPAVPAAFRMDLDDEGRIMGVT